MKHSMLYLSFWQPQSFVGIVVDAFFPLLDLLQEDFCANTFKKNQTLAVDIRIKDHEGIFCSLCSRNAVHACSIKTCQINKNRICQMHALTIPCLY